jgi:hypothetical protein
VYKEAQINFGDLNPYLTFGGTLLTAPRRTLCFCLLSWHVPLSMALT